jgi:hypothetical protein
MKCVCCGIELEMGRAVRVELTGPAIFVVQFACEPCGRKLARALVPHVERPLGWQAVA